MPRYLVSCSSLRRRWLAALIIAVVSLAVNLPSLAGASEQPNVLLIVLDAVRADHLGCYGYRGKTSPQIDRLASQGVLFENCIPAASWTLPSMASLFTGRYPRDHGVNSENFPLSPETRTMAEYLKASGYKTIGFSSNPWVGKLSKLDRGFDHFNEVWRTQGAAKTDEGAEITNEWIGEYFDLDYDGETPFFLFAFYLEPHFPYRPRKEYRDRFLPGSELAGVTERVMNWKHPREVGFVVKAPGMDVTPEEFAAMRALYDAEIRYTDDRIEELLNALRERKLLENTIVIITSDHGEHFGEHGFMDHKMSLYREVAHVPLIIWYPERLPAGKRVDSLVQNVDILSTLLQWIGVSPPEELNPPLPIDSADPSKIREYAFVEFARPEIFLDIIRKSFPEADFRPFDRSLRAVQSNRYKLIWASDGKNELYDLVTDPGEDLDLYSILPEKARQLEQVLERFNLGNTSGH